VCKDDLGGSLHLDAGHFGIDKTTWSFYRNIFIGQKFDRTSAIISDLILPVPFPSEPSRRKSYAPLFLLLRALGNPYRWITWLAFHPPRKEMIMYFWWFFGF
jgi:hypothetical protein